MKQEGLDFKVLARYLAGEESNQDKKEIDEWLEVNASNKQKLEEFQRIWESAAVKGDLKQKWTEIDEDWQKLKKKRDQPNYNVDKRLPKSDAFSSVHSNGNLKPFLQAAAIVLVAGLIGLLAYGFLQKEPVQKEASKMRVISTKKGERMRITLSGGTQILLNSDSKLKLPQKFAANKREVYLKGEAYFKVVHNANKPFLVHSGGVTTRDLGTSFVIRAYPGAKNILLVVVEGKVKFKSDHRRSGKGKIVTGKHLIKYNVKAHTVTKSKVKNMGLYLGWTKGHLNFKSSRMSKVAKRLERRYDVNILFKDEQIKNMQLTASLKSQDITSILNVIAKALDIQYQKEKSRIVFTYN